MVISGISLAVILLSLGLRHSFRFTSEIRYWNDSISWSDFRGFAPPLTKYDAGISSKLVIEYDSSLWQYKVYATMNQTKSWFKGDVDSLTEELLRHEQYHFNLTEACARLMNTYITDNPNKHLGFYQIRLSDVIILHEKMQNAYDTESDHSRRIGQQAKWEYKIDSMLLVNSIDKIYPLIDYYSGASAFFPSQPIKRLRDAFKLPVRHFELKKYGVNLSLLVIQNYKDSISLLAKGLDLFEKAKVKIKLNEEVENRNVIIEGSDSLNNNYYEMWHHDYPNQYITSVYFNSDDSSDRFGYLELAKSFVNSFKILNTDSLWLEDAKNYSLRDSIETAKFLVKYPKSFHHDCFVRQSPATYLSFLRGPIKTSAGDLIIAHDYGERNDSILFKQLVVLEKSKGILNVYGSNNMFYIPEKMGRGNKLAQIGFILQSDSSKTCPPFYNQLVKLPVENLDHPPFGSPYK